MTAHPDGFTNPESQQAARALALALFCALTTVLHSD